jgi:hypothetical protein
MSNPPVARRTESEIFVAGRALSLRSDGFEWVVRASWSRGGDCVLQEWQAQLGGQ